jgi:hypothetical protein
MADQRQPSQTFKQFLDGLSEIDVCCPICTTEWSSDESTVRTQCGHIYHKACLLQWVKPGMWAEKNTCPVCRGELFELFPGREDFAWECKLLAFQIMIDAAREIGLDQMTGESRFIDNLDRVVNIATPVWRERVLTDAQQRYGVEMDEQAVEAYLTGAFISICGATDNERSFVMTPAQYIELLRECRQGIPLIADPSENSAMFEPLCVLLISAQTLFPQFSGTHHVTESRVAVYNKHDDLVFVEFGLEAQGGLSTASVGCALPSDRPGVHLIITEELFGDLASISLVESGLSGIVLVTDGESNRAAVCFNFSPIAGRGWDRENLSFVQ